MKTRITIALFAIAALTISCIKESAPEATPSDNKVTVRVAIPDATKVTLTEASDHKSMALAWQDGDAISINGESFTIKDGFTAHEAEFEGDAPSGTPYTIIYPGKYTSAEAFAARSYAAQTQTGNASTAHLEYNAMLAGVTAYAEPKFDAAWAADNGGSLVQNAVLQFRLQLPEGVTTASSVSLVASRAIFPTTNAGTDLTKQMTLSLKDVTLPANRILEAYMMVSSAGVSINAGDELTIVVTTPGASYLCTVTLDAQTWTGGGQYTIQKKVSTLNSFDINTADDLIELRDGVNSGSIIWQTVYANLNADLNMSGVSSWTPIGNGTFTPVESGTVSAEWTEPAFKGTFDGKGHTIKNLVMTASPATYNPYGLFGILYRATVKDLTLGAASGDNGALNATPQERMDAGAVAGVAYGATVQNVTNYYPMTIPANSSSRRVAMGMVGYVYGDDASGISTLSGLNNYGKVSATQSSSNTGNGATSVQVAGIAGFSNTGFSSSNLISNCTNYADIEASCGRSSGILSAANTRTAIDGCVNRGNILNSFSNARIAGVCVIMASGASMSGCSNYGDVIATQNNTQLGGLVCMLNNANVTVSGGGNHGRILGDITSYHGTLIANMNNFAAVDGLVAGGAYGKYNGGDYTYTVLTDANYMAHIGKISSGNESKVTNITFEAWDGYPSAKETLISNVSDLLDFAAKVNSGKFESDEVAKLTADIDCSSITDWTPIGDCAFSSWSATALSVSDESHLFKGTFDGQNHSIKNLSMSFSNSGSWKAFGFFAGLDDGAAVKDLTFDSSCSMSVSASFGGAFGVLAGLAKGATVSNVKNYANISGGGSGLANNNANGRVVVGGIVGLAMCTGANASLDKLYNAGNFGSPESHFSNGGNVGNGANGFMVGGLVGFASTNGSSCRVTISNGVNDGNLYSNAGRASGIVSSANQYTTLSNCTNNGSNTSSASGTFRLGNITCIAGNGSVLDSCVNRGDLTALNCESVAGVVCLVNHGTVQFIKCSSLGATILGKNVNVGGSQTYNGVLFGYCNNAATFTNCSVNGKIGTSADNLVTLTAENYFQYVGQKGAKGTNVTTDNIKFASE